MQRETFIYKYFGKALDVVTIPLENRPSTDIQSMRSSFVRADRILKLMALMAVIVSLGGCAPTPITQKAVSDYKSVAAQISIGDAREYVLAILQTNQQVIPSHFKRQPERYLSYGEQVEIHFIRTGLTSGTKNLDDDFTPYVFKNDVLMSVGWTYVSKTDFHDKAREAISAGGVKPDQDVVGDRR